MPRVSISDRSLFNPSEADEPARGGQGFDSPPLGASRWFPIDTPLLAAGKFIN